MEIFQAPKPHASSGLQATDIPQGIIEGAQAKLGHFTKACILYFHRQCQQMNALKWAPRGQRMPYWLWNKGMEMKRETVYLDGLVEFILRCCRMMHERHQSRRSIVAHLNLQRRCIYQLSLCLRVILDTRLMAEGDQFYLTGNEHLAEPQTMGENMTKVRTDLNWVAGVNVAMTRERIVRTPVRVSLPHYYPGGRQYRVMLPPQFVHLLKKIYGNTFRIPAFLMRRCLTYYCLYLVHIIWYPKHFVDYLSVGFYDHQTVFNTHLTAMEIALGRLPDPSCQPPRWFTDFKTTFDGETYRDVNSTQIYAPETPGVFSEDNMEYDCDLDFIHFCDTLYNRELRTMAAPDTFVGIWRSLMV